MCFQLADSLCSIYELRPFGCRCLVSRNNCGEKGYAEIDEFVLSVNTVFLQTIEHVDANGCTGNLVDVLKVLSSAYYLDAYENKTLNCENTGLISNHPLTALMIPPEHRIRMEPILNSFRPAAPASNHATEVAGRVAASRQVGNQDRWRGVAPGVPRLLSANASLGTTADIIAASDWALGAGRDANILNYSLEYRTDFSGQPNRCREPGPAGRPRGDQPGFVLQLHHRGGLRG